jgi:hypothetical protein
VYGRDIVAPPGNQAANGEHKLHAYSTEDLSLLDKKFGAVPLSRETGFSPWEEGRDTKVVLRDSRYGL